MIAFSAADISTIIADDLDALRFLASLRGASPARRRLRRALDRMPSRIARAGPFQDQCEVTALALREISGALEALQALSP